MLPADSVPAKILADIDFEVSNSDEVISFGIKVKDDCDNFFVLATLVSFETLYHRFQQYIHVGFEIKHDLASLFLPNKPLSQLITDGLYIFAHVKTNSADLFKTAIFEWLDKLHLKPAKAAVATFL